MEKRNCRDISQSLPLSLLPRSAAGYRGLREGHDRGDPQRLLRGPRRFRSGISKLSSNKAVSEVTKIALNLLQLEDEDDGEAGVTICVSDEVPANARNVALHPENWFDFPIPDDDDFDFCSSNGFVVCVWEFWLEFL